MPSQGPDVGASQARTPVPPFDTSTLPVMAPVSGVKPTLTVSLLTWSWGVPRIFFRSEGLGLAVDDGRLGGAAEAQLLVGVVRAVVALAVARRTAAVRGARPAVVDGVQRGVAAVGAGAGEAAVAPDGGVPVL